MCFIHLQGAFTVLHLALNKFKAIKEMFYQVKSDSDTSLWSNLFYFIKTELLDSKPQVDVCDKQLFD